MAARGLEAYSTMEFKECHADDSGLRAGVSRWKPLVVSVFSLLFAFSGHKVVQLSLRLTSFRKPAVQTLSHAPLATEAGRPKAEFTIAGSSCLSARRSGSPR